MSDGDVQYEFKDVRTVRGLEAKTITKWQKDGWELHAQERGTLQTKLTFRRQKPKAPWRLIAIVGGGIAVILTVIIIIGIQVEARSPELAPPTAQATAAQSEQPLGPSTEETKPSQPKRSYSNEYIFGEAADFTSTGRTGSIPLTFTVETPVAFTPGKEAFVKRVYSNILYEGELREHTIYFKVTITNHSDTLTYDPMIFGQVGEAHADEGEVIVSDGEIDGDFNADIGPGQSRVVMDGFSVHTLDGLVYELRVDGLRGRTFYFRAP